MPYNYLIDPILRKRMNINITDCILIIDEAHNLEKNCTESASFDLSAITLAMGIGEVQKCLKILNSENNDYFQLMNSELKEKIPGILEKLLSFEKEIQKIEFRKSDDLTLTEKGDFIFQILENSNITRESFDGFNETLDKIIDIISNEKDFHGVQTPSLSDISKIFNLIFTKKSEDEDDNADHYRCHVKLDQSFFKIHQEKKTLYEEAGGFIKDFSKTKTLSLWCLTPSITMQILKSLQPRCFILTSGTLSPLDSYEFELGIDFEVKLENPHVINDDQLCVIVARKGPNGIPFNSSYTKKSDEYKEEIGNFVVSLSRVIPDGMLIFFPSYSSLQETLQNWKINKIEDKTIWETIDTNKKIIIEPKESSQLQKSIKDYEYEIDNGNKGAIYMAVCRGKASEGIDFSHRYGRAVLVIGLPFPPHKDPKIVLKMAYLNEISKKIEKSSKNLKTLSGLEWYNQQASRAVNQAIGRVLRNRYDYGAIILVDERFATNKDQISKWIRPHIKVSDNHINITRHLTKFFNKATSEFGKNSEKLMEKFKKKDVMGSLTESQILEEFDSQHEKKEEFKEPKKESPQIVLNTKTISEEKKKLISQFSYKAQELKKMKEENPETSNTIYNLPKPTTKASTPSIRPSFSSPKSSGSNTPKSNHSTPKSNHSTPNFSTPTKSSTGSNTPITPVTPNTPKTPETIQISKSPQSESKGSFFIQKLKSIITDEDYKEFKKIMKSFNDKKQSPNTKLYEDLIKRIKPIFEKTKEVKDELFEGFKVFFPDSFHQNYDKIVNEEKPKKEKRSLEYDLFTGTNKKKKVYTSSQNNSQNSTPSSNSNLTPKSNESIDLTNEDEIILYDPIIPDKKSKEEDLKKDEDLKKNDQVEKRKCFICFEEFKNPHNANCGHVACKECWDEWLKRKIECPICKEKVRVKHLRPVFI